MIMEIFIFFFQAEDGIRDLVRSRGLGDVYKRQGVVDTLTIAVNVFSASNVGEICVLSSTSCDIKTLSLIHI